MLIIFDLDGTLLNSIQDLSNATNYALQTCGYPLRTTAECLQFVGSGVSKLLERALPQGKQTPEHIASLRPFFIHYYNTHFTDCTFPYPGMKQTLCALKARGHQLAVASNKYHAATQKTIAHFFPDISFAVVLGQRDGAPVKPNPAIVEEILKTTKTAKEECLYVGDSDVDMQTARNAGVKSCAALWGFRPREVLEAFTPDFLIERPEDLLKII